MRSALQFLQRTRRPGDLIFALFFLSIALALTTALPWQVKFVSATRFFAQPAFWPVVGVSMMVGFGVVHLFATINSPRISGRLREVVLWLRSFEFTVWFYGYVVVIPVMGYLPATVLFVLLLCLRLGYRSGKLLICAVLFAVAVVLVFKSGLGVALPAGELYDYLPGKMRNFMMNNF